MCPALPRLLALFMPLALLAHSAAAQPVCTLCLSGKLSEQGSGQPLAYGEVRLLPGNQVMLTDSAGSFSFPGLCPGHYVLIGLYAGADSVRMPLVLSADQQADLQLSLRSLALSEVLLTAARIQSYGLLTASRLSERQMEAQAGKPLAAQLAALPGLSQLSTGATIAKPVLHGLHSNRLLILNNGIRLEGQQWGSDHAPEIDPFLATRLTVVKGAAAVRYGPGAVAGVILVEPRALRDSAGLGGDFHLVGESNGRALSASGSLEGRLLSRPAWVWRLQGTFRRGGSLRAPDYFLENTASLEANYSATLAYQGKRLRAEAYYSQFYTRLGILTAAHLGSRSDLERALERGHPAGADTLAFTWRLSRPYQQIVHRLLKASLVYSLSSASTLRLSYAFQHNLREEFDKHRPRGSDPETGKPAAELNFRIYTHLAELEWERAWEGWRLSAGLVGLGQNNRVAGRPFIPNFVAANGEAYTLLRRTASPRLEWEIGGRYDYRWVYSAREEAGRDIFSQQHFQSASWAAGGRLRLGEAWRLSAYLSSAWRPPQVNELFSEGLHHGAAAFERGDSTLRPERGLKGIATLSKSGRLRGELSLWYHRFGNFIYLRPDGIAVTIRGTFPAYRYVQAPALLAGADLDLSWQWARHWQAALRGAWLYAQQLDAGQPLIFMPPGWAEAELTCEPEGQRWHVSLGARRTARQQRYPEGQDLLPPPPGFTLLHLRGGVRLPLARGSLIFSASAENLANIAYRSYLDRLRYFADAPGRNISFHLHYTF